MKINMVKCSVDGCDEKMYARECCHKHWKRLRRYGDPLAGRIPHGEALRYFQEVVLPHDENRCLLWPYSRTPQGYAKFWLDGRVQSVSRAACIHVHGHAPSPHHECAHGCGRGHLGCVAPTHLRWATPIENNADKHQHGTVNSGERNGAARLTEDDVRAIRALKGKKLQREIGALFGITQTHVSTIHRGKIWSSVH